MTTAGPLKLGEILRRTPVGESIYLTQESPVIAAYAAQAGLRVTTAKLLAIHVATKDLTDITRVTIVSRTAEYPAPAARPVRRVRTTV